MFDLCVFKSVMHFLEFSTSFLSFSIYFLHFGFISFVSFVSFPFIFLSFPVVPCPSLWPPAFVFIFYNTVVLSDVAYNYDDECMIGKRLLI